MMRWLVCALLCGAVGCSSPEKSNNDENNEPVGDGCEALRVDYNMQCVNSCGAAGPPANFSDAADAGGSSEPFAGDSGSNAPPPPDFGNGDPPQPVDMGSVSDLGQPDFGPPIDWGTPPDPDAGGFEPDQGFEYADFCELTLNGDGTISEWHGDNETFGTWSCSDGVVRVDSDYTGRTSYVLEDDGCLDGSDYSFK